MRKLYDELIQRGEAGINDLVAQRAQETVELEFKEKANAATGEFDKDDARNFGKELSALSNSMGGLLIWGVRAKKQPGDDFDCASQAVPIANIAKFKNEAIRWTSSALMPRHDGVFIESVPSSIAGAGYLLVLVERSERRPHRSEVAGDKHYYKRSGDSAMMMEHYDVEDAFKRFTVPSLKATYRLHSGGSSRSASEGWYHINVLLTLENQSEVSARHPYLIIERGSSLREHYKEQQILSRQHKAALMYYAGSDVIIHPGLSLDMTTMQFSVPILQTVSFPYSPKESPNFANMSPVSITLKTGCDNSRVSTETLTIEPSEMASVLPTAMS